ncbi:YggS family pyridoxal phosphate-dependent enzyme [Microbacterium excoecariae]|uniref:YggS family pyridoxal phosphate-dependent enzyme n=1 Tax=Microbacterium excoecariae TaxID=2715210 RepID=UPI00140885FA|nr:YggS family pyridoxal phosphate-dependent enzyme [Microbacterium excoecariae]NHI16650.1 YggS family pyridoxal phosphate-dependent enzyme [Microbacterium excoecariae]
MTTLAERLAAADAAIAASAARAGRDPRDLTRIVVTKFHPASLVRELSGLGVRDVAENRQQELTAKTAETADLAGLTWHFVGQVQTKKARAVRRAARVVHSVDRERLVDALDRAGEDDAPLDALVQVNLTADPNRGGVDPQGLDALAERIAAADTLRLRGVMAVAPLGEEPARAFDRLAGYAARVRGIEPAATWVSAGMSQDFDEAIACGATHLRIGTAITGPRPPQD